MHELGIVMHMIDQVEKTAAENDVERVVKIVLEVGEVSGIVPELFEEAYDWAKKKTKHLQDAELDLIVLEGLSFCRDCRKTYPTSRYGRECPNCGSGNTYLVSGNEVTIKELQVI